MIDWSLLREMVNTGYVCVREHPEANLQIFNYTAAAQYDRKWNSVTRACQGLILDSNRVVVRPFKKFFNLQEYELHEIPNEPFDVYEKIDGSLGILYWLDDSPRIATRGSFISEQAVMATEMLHDLYAHTILSCQ